MARATNGFTEWMFSNNAPVTAYPMTFAIWFNVDGFPPVKTLISIGDKDVDTKFIQLMITGDGPSPIGWRGDMAGSTWNAETTTNYDGGSLVWGHACGVSASATDHSVYLNGGSKGTDTASVTLSDIDSVAVGARASLTKTVLHAGGLAEGAIWNVALTEPEIQILALGYRPILVRPQSLVAYWPLIGKLSPEPDIFSNFNLNIVDTPGQRDHVRVNYAVPPKIIIPTPPPIPPHDPRRSVVIYSPGGYISV